jgi:zinc protease
MKKYTVLFFLSFLFLLVVSGQNSRELPLDPKVRYGKLDNGLTYYIRQNSLPEKRAEFYLAQKVGSMQEEDNQAGLAHFLEHMAFSSTKHFPDKVIDQLERYGAQMGQNINAYTSFDETVYYLSGIPLTSQGVLDTCLLILHDWSGYISLRDEDIDKERLVIKEEWRTRNNASSRMWDKQLPVIFKGSKYADRMPIGKMEVVENFPYQVLKDYYHKWYRPDLQGIIVIGDFDAEEVETKVKKLFSGISKPVNPAKRIYYPVPDNDKPIVSIATDPEATSTGLSVYYKHDLLPVEQRNTEDAFVLSCLQNLTSQMISNRLSEIAQKADAPFSYAYVYDGNFFVSKTKGAWTAAANCKEGKVKESLAIIVRENERATRFGFTDAEIERTKANILSNYENNFNNKDKQYNSAFISPYLSHFLTGRYASGIEYEYDLAKKILAGINSQMLNNFIKYVITGNNIVIAVSGPEKEGLLYPAEKELLETVEMVKTENITAYEETLSKEPLVSSLPTPGKVVKTETGDKYGETVWTLSNGMKIVIKKTAFRDDQIMMSGKAFGGTSLFSDNEYIDISYVSAVPSIGGVGNFSIIDLPKVLAGKAVSVRPSISRYEVGMSGSSSIKDVETMLQLTYLYFTSPRKDIESFAAFKEREINSLKNRKLNPSYIFSDSISKTQYGNHPRNRRIELEDVDKINYDRIISMYKECFANPGAFVFTFVGTVDENSLKPLVEKYLASLPSGNRNISHRDLNMDIRKGRIINHFGQKMETPKASVFALYSGSIKRDATSLFKIEILNQILQQVYMRTMRKEEGGTYGVSAGFGIARLPESEATLRISYTTDPERVTELDSIIHREIKILAEEGPLEEEFNKAMEGVVKNRTEWQEMNGFWIAVLDIYYRWDDDENTNFLNRIRAITKEDIKNLVNELVSQGNMIDVVMTPQ